MKQSLFWTLIIVFLSFGLAQAQTKVTGKVTDSKTGEPMPFVSITVKGTNNGTNTDIDGKYSINVANSHAILKFSFVGYNEVEEKVETRSTLDVQLTPSAELLEEVVVIGYGTGVKIGTQVGSIARVSSNQIKEKPVANVSDALQGKVAGLQVLTSSGEISGSSEIRMRGIGSISSGNAPLFILDGSPVSQAIFLSLNSSDIESMTFLKDASSTSIYGSRAANGVIYITSKSGKFNEKAVVNLQAQMGFSQLASHKFYNNLMSTSELLDFWKESGIKSKEDIENIQNNYGNINTNWTDYFYKSAAPLYQATLNIQGGSAATSYFISGGYYNAEGIVPNSSMKRYNARTNISSKLNNIIKVGTNIGATYVNTKVNSWLGIKDEGIYRMLPYKSPVYINGVEQPYFLDSKILNPYYIAEKNPINYENIYFNGLAFVEIKPFSNFTLRSQYSLDAFDSRHHYKSMPSYIPNEGKGYSKELHHRETTSTITNTLEYKFSINQQHNVTLLAGQEGIKFNYHAMEGSSGGQTDDRLMTLSAGKTPSSGERIEEYIYLSFFSRADYNYMNKYYLNASLRGDKSSRFGRNKRSEIFYSGGAMWHAKKESFLENVSWLDELKFRFSIGTSGNSNIGQYEHLATIGLTSPYGNESIYQNTTSWVLNKPGNENLTWEKQTMTSIGFETTVFDRFHFTFDYYDRRTSDLLINTPFPGTSGFTSILGNAGALKNSGVEFSLDVDVLKGKDYFIGVSANFSYNKNKITKLSNNQDKQIFPGSAMSYVVGKTITHTLPLFAAVDPATGDQLWYLPGSDISETTREGVTKQFSEELLQSTGKPIHAPYYGGFGLNAKWKGLSFSSNFAFVLENWIINNDRYFTENPSAFENSSNQTKRMKNFWKKPGDKTDVPRPNQVFEFDDRLLENASFLRLKDITLSYELPTDILNILKYINKVRVFASVRNLMTITKFTGADPETHFNMAMGQYPNPRQYTFGLELTF